MISASNSTLLFGNSTSPTSSTEISHKRSETEKIDTDQMRLDIDPDVQLAVEALGSLAENKHFMHRVSNIPLVNQSLTQIGAAYKATKNYSRVVRYSAETVESSVRSISRPVIQTVAPALAPLDRFACNQLDKLEKSFPSIISPTSQQPVFFDRLRTISTDSIPMSVDNFSNDSVQNSSPSTVESSPMLGPTPDFKSNAPRVERQPRRSWSLVSGNLGSMAISEEMLRGLRYCLTLLKHATEKIERQIAVLLTFLRSSNEPTPPLSPQTNNQQANPMAVIISIKNDLVQTLKKVVDLIGKYASAYLPFEAKRRVKGSILALPGRCATLTEAADTPETEAQRVLALANESSAMMKSVTGVFSQTVDSMEAVLGK